MVGNKDNFEKKYMDNSWKNEVHQSYKVEDIDQSIKDFNNFLESEKIKGKLLDLGCGNGKNTIYFQKRGWDALGIDFSKSAIEICKSNSAKSKSECNFKVASVLEFKTSKRFETIIDCGCLHHIRRSLWPKYKQTIVDCLKVGGYVYIHGISDCNENKQLKKHPNKRNWIINKKGHYTTFYSTKDMKKLLGKNFKIEKEFQFKSQNSPLMVRGFYIKRLK